MQAQLSDRHTCRWKYVGGSVNAARSMNVSVKGLLHLLARMRQGLQVHSGMLHLPLSLQHTAAC